MARELNLQDSEALAQLLRMTPDQLKTASDEEAREFAVKWREAFGNKFPISGRLRKAASLARALQKVHEKGTARSSYVLFQ